MGRNFNPGISWYRRNSGHIQYKEMRLLYNDCGADGYYIVSCIEDFGHLNCGFYFDMLDEFEFFATDYCRKTAEEVTRVIDSAIKRGIFDAGIAEKHKILTSVEMQDKFIYASSERRKKGSIFEIPAEWLLLKFKSGIPPGNIEIVPVKNFILPGRNQIVPGNNPQTIETTGNKNETFVAATAASPVQIAPISTPLSPEDGKPARKRNAGPRKLFIAPTMEEAIVYFMRQYNPKNPATWFPDRCRSEAFKFWHHYNGNGWRQGKGSGRPLVSWESAAALWITRAREGAFANDGVPATVGKKTAYPAEIISQQPRESSRNPFDREINFLFDKFRENADNVKIPEVEVAYYDYMKTIGMIQFPDPVRVSIQKIATEFLNQSEIPVTESILTIYMKKIAVLEVFKLFAAADRKEIFLI